MKKFFIFLVICILSSLSVSAEEKFDPGKHTDLIKIFDDIKVAYTNEDFEKLMLLEKKALKY